jgi:DNA polymerase III subunit delta'
VSADHVDPRDNDHHPRKRTGLRGHERAERLLLRQLRSGRMHHGWLLSGRRGIGKATFAYRLARFVLRFPNLTGVGDVSSLHVPAESAVARRVASGGHPDLLFIERRFDSKTGRIKSEIGVDDIRRTGEFFGHTPSAGGWRVCIIDTADDLNSESANALLKTLEEPPAQSLVILVSHQPRGLLPTLRSRCIEVGLAPLSLEDTVEVVKEIRPGDNKADRAAVLSRGSPGRALEIMDSPGAKAFETFILRLERLASVDTKLAVADAFQGRGTAEDFAIFCELLLGWVGEKARATAIAGKGAHLALAHDTIVHSIRRTDALNLDRRQTVLDALTVLEDAVKAA